MPVSRFIFSSKGSPSSSTTSAPTSPARRENEIIFPDLFNRCTHAEPGDIGIFSGPLVTPPCMVGIRDLSDIFWGEFPVNTVFQHAKFPGIDEENFSLPVFEFMILFVTGNEPEADGDLGGIKQTARASPPCSLRGPPRLYFSGFHLHLRCCSTSNRWREQNRHFL